MTVTGQDHDQLVSLVYELLDAHHDTAQIAQDLPPDPDWDAHLEYLRALQRTARCVLASASADVEA